MDLDLTQTLNSPQTKSPNDSDESNDTPPHNSKTFTKNSHHHRAPPHSVAVGMVYKECLKNHAAAIGGHAVDGCGEFMPAGVDPTSLKCAACGCHRNFHRREPGSATGLAAITPPFIDFRRPAQVRRFSLSPSPPAVLEKVSVAPKFAPENQILSTLRTASPEEHHQAPPTPTAGYTSTTAGGGRKRFRTKFSQEQKEKMQDFTEKMGWKLQKSDDGKVRDFCKEIGVSRGVLKVWMQNNKTAFAKDGNHVRGGDTMLMAGDDRNNDNCNYIDNSNTNSSNNDMGFVVHSSSE